MLSKKVKTALVNGTRITNKESITTTIKAQINRFKASVTSSSGSWITSISVIIFLIVANIIAGTVRAQIATIEHISGQVQVAPAGTSTRWKNVYGKSLLRAGKQIRVGSDSSARLYFNDGSRVSLKAGSLVTLDKLSGNWLRSINVIMIQEAGSTRHNVQNMRGAKSGYLVVTPSGTASVRGTSFSVAVDESGYARFSVDSGSVVVRKETNEVAITAGQALVTRAESPELDAAYQFTLSGPLAVKKPDGWSVNGVNFMVAPEALDGGDPQTGSQVFVEGHIMEGHRIADHVSVLGDSETRSTFTGILNEKGEKTWLVGGVKVLVDDDTDIVGTPDVDQAVQVVFTVSPEGLWDAKVIITLEKPVEIATTTAPASPATATLTPTSTATATVTIIPTVTHTPTSTVTPLVVTGDYTITKNDQVRTIFCDSAVVTVKGSSNRITLSGTCKHLTVRGNNNRITLETPVDYTDKGKDNIISVLSPIPAPGTHTPTPPFMPRGNTGDVTIGSIGPAR